MLTDLHNKLQTVAPIDGVADLGNGQYRIDFQSAATQAEQDAAQAIVDGWVDPPKPDWAGFRLALYAEDAWKRVLNSNPAVGATIASCMWQLQTDSTLAVEVTFLWDSLIPGLDPALSTAEVAALNQIAIDNNISMAVGDDGFLSFSD